MKKLERRLGLGAAVAIGIGAALGSGVFVLPAIAITHTGPSAWLAYFVAALCILPACFSKAELATAMPSSGGTYVYIERTFGPLAGTVAGLGLFLTMLLKSSFALVGFGAYLSILADLPLIPTALTLLLVMVIVNILGVGKVSSALIVIVSLSLISLFVLSFRGLYSFDSAYMEPYMPNGVTEFLYTISLVFISYAGVTKLAAIAEEIKNPEKNLPLGILLSVFLISIIYSLVTYVLAGNLPMSAFEGNLKPIYTLAESFGGPIMGTVAAVIAILTMSSQANAGILASSRFPFAMSRDQLSPSLLGRLNRKYLTPVWSILLSGFIVAICLLTLDVESIAKLASAYLFLIYAIENVAVIVLRETRVQWYKPAYKSPFYPWIQILGVLVSVFVFMIMGFTMVFAVLVVSIPGVLLFIFFGRHQTERKGVLGFRGRRKDLIEDLNSLDPSKPLELIDFSQDANVVVSLFGKEKSPEMLFEIGVSLSDQGKVEVAFLTEIPEQTDLDDIQEDSSVIRSIRRRILTMSEKQKVEMCFDPIVSHDIFKSLNDISQRFHCRWLVIEWVGRTHGAFTIHNPMGWLKDHLACNLAMVRDNGVRYIRKIIVILKANVGDRFLIDTGEHLSQVYNAELTFARFTCAEEDDEKRYDEYNYLKKVAGYCKVLPELLILKGSNEVNEIIKASEEFDLLVFGSEEATLRGLIFGTDEEKLMLNAACSVLSVQSSGTNHDWMT